MNSNRRSKFKYLAACTAAVLLGGCAAAPIQEMSDARQSLQAANAVDARTHAPALLHDAEDNLGRAEQALGEHAYSRAKQEALTAKQHAVAARTVTLAMQRAERAATEADGLGLEDDATAALLKRARDEATTTDNDEDTIRLAEEVAVRLRERINQFYLEKAGPLIDKARTLLGGGDDEHTAELNKIEKAYHNREGKTAYDDASILVDELNRTRREQPSASEVRQQHIIHSVTTYTVAAGDSLWGIAAKPQIYGDPRYWPLIYKSNTDKIKDADLIFAGQVLDIDRNPSPDAVKAALAHASAREKWSIGTVEAIDKAYIEHQNQR